MLEFAFNPRPKTMKISVGLYGTNAHQIALAMRADLFDIDCDFYLAGPVDFVKALSGELRAAGVPLGQIFAQVL